MTWSLASEPLLHPDKGGEIVEFADIIVGILVAISTCGTMAQVSLTGISSAARPQKAVDFGLERIDGGVGIVIGAADAAGADLQCPGIAARLQKGLSKVQAKPAEAPNSQSA